MQEKIHRYAQIVLYSQVLAIIIHSVTEKKSFVRGRRPGVPIEEYAKRPNPNDRPSLQRFSVSVPIELARVVRLLKSELDLEYSKIFRKGLGSDRANSIREGRDQQENIRLVLA